MALELNLRDNHTFLRDIDLHEISKKSGTPLFLYDLDCIKQKITLISKNLGDDIKLFYSVKANPNIEILRCIKPYVSGADISSGGELAQVLRAGFSPEQVSFAGPGKTDKELESAIDQGVASISIESVNELKRANDIAVTLGKKANVSIRINPTKIPEKFSVKMGGKPSQFGIDQERYQEFFNVLRESYGCNFVGIHVFSGTQCLDEQALVENAANILQISKEIVEATSIGLKTINFGGGFGIPYHEGQKEINIEQVCREIVRQFNEFKEQNGLADAIGIFELGRYIVAEAGVYIAQIVDIKESRGKKICVLDGGMNHHLAASGKFGQLIRENFKIINISNPGGKNEQVTLTGPLCTSLDILAERLQIAETKIGNYIAVLNSGAYVYTASPLLFLSKDTPVELLVVDNSVRMIRKSLKAESFN